MNAARHWPGYRLLLTCLGLCTVFASFRWSLVAGTHQATIVNRRVMTTGGVWSPAFASTMSLIGVGVLVVILAWAITMWIFGRHERRASATVGHRKILM